MTDEKEAAIDQEARKFAARATFEAVKEAWRENDDFIKAMEAIAFSMGQDEEPDGKDLRALFRTFTTMAKGQFQIVHQVSSELSEYVPGLREDPADELEADGDVIPFPAQT